MNILHITRRFHPFIGGVETYIYDVSKRLVKRNTSCRIITLNYDIFDRKNKLNNYEKIDGIEIFRIPGIGYYKIPIPLKIPFRLFKWADIVHIHDVRFLYETSLILKAVYKYKIVLSTHGFVFHTNDLKVLKNIMVPLYYKPTINKFIDATICVSKQDLRCFRKMQINNLRLIENGIDYNKFSIIPRKPINDKLLYYGRIDTNKGLDSLFKILSILIDKRWHLDIVGSGFGKIVDSLKYLATVLGISERVMWHGNVSDKILSEYISKAYLCFLPSTYEGFGFTLVESMASGCVCIANTIETYKDIIDEAKNGYLVNYANEKDSAKSIGHLLDISKDKYLQVSKNAKEKAKKYDWEEKIGEIVKIYEGVLK